MLQKICNILFQIDAIPLNFIFLNVDIKTQRVTVCKQLINIVVSGWLLIVLMGTCIYLGHCDKSVTTL